jgi:hypothetical protein
MGGEISAVRWLLESYAHVASLEETLPSTASKHAIIVIALFYSQAF